MTSLRYIHGLASESERMLKTTKASDIRTMIETLEYAHNLEVPLLNYNNETDLTAAVNCGYLTDCGHDFLLARMQGYARYQSLLEAVAYYIHVSSTAYNLS